MWMSKFKIVKDYKASHGHCILSRHHALSYWAYYQGYLKKSNELCKERFDLLNSIGFFNNHHRQSMPRFRQDPSQKTVRRQSLPLSYNRASCSSPHKCLMGRIRFLGGVVGLTFTSNESLCKKVEGLETQLFGRVKEGTIKDRIDNLEKEIE